MTTSLVSHVSDADALEITENQARFLEAYAETGSITEASLKAGVTRDCHYGALRRSASYAAAFKAIRRNAAAERIVDRMVERAIEGDLVTFKDQIVTDPDSGLPLRKFDTILQIYLSKALAGLSDNGPTSRQGNSGPTINVIMPGNSQPPTIEVQFDSDPEPPTLD